MTGWIAREARRLAAFCPGGRLDPPLSLRLDEAALICPIPLHQWTADMGGRGVSIVACFQSRAQVHRPLRRRQDRHDHQQLRAPGCCSAAPATATTSPTGRRWPASGTSRSPPPTCTGASPRAPPAGCRCWRPPSSRPCARAGWSCSPPRSRRSSGGPSRRSAASTCAPTTPRRRGASAPASGSRARPSPGCAARPSLPPARSAGSTRGIQTRRSGRPQRRLGARHGSSRWSAGSSARSSGWPARACSSTGWRRWRRPAVAWLATRCLAARRRLTAWWSTARRWRARRRARVDYQPFPQHAPARTRGGADLAEPPAPHSPLFGDPDA